MCKSLEKYTKKINSHCKMYLGFLIHCNVETLIRLNVHTGKVEETNGSFKRKKSKEKEGNREGK